MTIRLLLALFVALISLPCRGTDASISSIANSTPTASTPPPDDSPRLSTRSPTAAAPSSPIKLPKRGDSARSLGPSCTKQSGSLQLKVNVIRAIGISPLLVFFDATTTVDSAATTSVAQDVTFSWSFGDTGASGSGTWAYGSSPGENSMNSATGIVAAHLYRTPGRDGSYTSTVTATDGANTASCDIGVTAYDPNGSKGFPGASTTCIDSSSTPVPGRGGCPAGANVLRTSSIQTALSRAYGNGKRLLFRCGSSFSGDTSTDNITAVKWAIGAYGGCEGTQSNRPIMLNNGSNYIFEFSDQNGNGIISDLDCEGNASPNGGCIWGNDKTGIMYQVTIYNLYSNNEKESFAWNQCSQCGLVQDYQNNMVGPDTEIGTYINIGAFSHYPLSGSVFNNIAYQAIIGSHFDGGKANYANNAETVRVFGCQECYFANNDFLNAGPYYAQLKLHAGGASAVWSGEYTQYIEISDNYFGGTSGANAVELSPENSVDDERLRYIVVERNIFDGIAKSGRQLLVAGENITFRDNAFLMRGDTAFGIQVCQRGIEPAPRGIEAYNNTFYGPNGSYNSAAITVSNAGCGGKADTSNSFFKNNLGYFPGNRGGVIPMVSGGGSGNIVSDNSSNTLSNPVWTNPSETLRRMSDWRPTQNYSGGVNVPVFYDALGHGWSGTWDLGAVHH